MVISIDGANALKLDESFEIKNTEQQNTLIDNYENKEENNMSSGTFKHEIDNRIPEGVSIESASYIEKNEDIKADQEDSFQDDYHSQENIEEEYTPKLFSEEKNEEIFDQSLEDQKESDQLFDHENSEEDDFEIPAFLRRQKF